MMHINIYYCYLPKLFSISDGRLRNGLFVIIFKVSGSNSNIVDEAKTTRELILITHIFVIIVTKRVSHLKVT